MNDTMQAKDSTIRIFWIALTTHVIAWTLLCWITQPNLPLDMVEMTYWGQQWQWGYHKHPPLPAWIAASVWSVGGNSPLLMYFTSQLTIAVTFWAVWQMAREGLKPWMALCAVGVLQACYYCTFLINDINNTIITRPFWALAILFLYRATKPEASIRTMWWLLTGIVIGLGMLSKYYIGVLVLSMMAVPLLVQQTRWQLKTPGPWLMATVALLIFTPHLIWMFDSDFITLSYIVNRGNESAPSGLFGHVISPLSFLGSQTGAWFPVLFISIPLISFAAIWRSLKGLVKRQTTSYFRNYLSIVVLGPILIYVVLAAVTGSNIRSMWGGPLFSFFGVLLIELSKDARGEFQYTPKVRKGVRNCLIAASVMLIGLFCRNALSPVIRDDFSRVHFPGQAVADEVHRRWKSRVNEPLTIVGGELFSAGCVAIYSSDHLDVYTAVSAEINPWLNDEKVAQRGGVFLWNIGDWGNEPPQHWLDRFEGATVMEPIELPARAPASNRIAKVGMVFVPPKNLIRSAGRQNTESNGSDSVSRR